MTVRQRQAADTPAAPGRSAAWIGRQPDCVNVLNPGLPPEIDNGRPRLLPRDHVIIEQLRQVAAGVDR